MATLMDRINKGMTDTPTQATTSQAGIEKILKAKSGKAGGGASVPAASSLAAETATAQAQSELRQGAFRGALAGAEMQQKSEQISEQKKLGEQALESKGRMAKERMQAESKIAADQRRAREEQARTQRTAEENMRMDAMEASATQRLRDLATQRDLTIDNIFADFDRSNKELALRKDAAELEQLGFDLAMSDRAYMDELNRVGRERLLSNELQFSEESARITLGDQLEATLQRLDWARDFNGDRRNWEQKLGQMTIQNALDLYEAQVEAANQRAFIEGATGALQAGYQYGAKEGYFGQEAHDIEHRRSYDNYGQSSIPTYQETLNKRNTNQG